MSTVEKIPDSVDFTSKNIDSTEPGTSESSVATDKKSSSETSHSAGKEESTDTDSSLKKDVTEKDTPAAVPDSSPLISKSPEKMTKETKEETQELTNGIDKEPESSPLPSGKSFSELMAESEELPDTVLIADTEEMKTNESENLDDKKKHNNTSEQVSENEISSNEEKKVSQSQEEKQESTQDVLDQDVSEKLVTSSTPNFNKKEPTEDLELNNLSCNSENDSLSLSLHLSQTQLFPVESTAVKSEEADRPSKTESKNKEVKNDDLQVEEEVTKSTEAVSVEEIPEPDTNIVPSSDSVAEKVEKQASPEKLVTTEKPVVNDSVNEASEKDCIEKLPDSTSKMTSDEEVENKVTSESSGNKENTDSPTKTENEPSEEKEKPKEEFKSTEGLEEKKDIKGKSKVVSKLIKTESTRKSLRRSTREKSEKKEDDIKTKDKNNLEKVDDGASKPNRILKSVLIKDQMESLPVKENAESQEISNDSPETKIEKNSSDDNEKNNDEIKSQIKEHVETISTKIMKYVKSKSRNDNILIDCIALLKEIDSLVGGPKTEVVENIGPVKNRQNAQSKKEVKTPAKRKSTRTKSEERSSLSPPKKINTGQEENAVTKSTSKNGLAVFAKWPNSGWYYPGTVEGLAGNEWKDASNVTVCFYDGLRRDMKNINILPAHVIPSGSVLCSIDDETEMSVVACERESESCVNFTLAKKNKENEVVQLNFNKLAVKGLNMKSIKQQLEQLNVDIVPKNMHVVSLDNLVCGRRSRGRSLVVKDSPVNKKADSPSKKDPKASNEPISPEKKVENVPQTPAKSTPSKRQTRSSSTKETPTKRRASARHSVKIN